MKAVLSESSLLVIMIIVITIIIIISGCFVGRAVGSVITGCLVRHLALGAAGRRLSKHVVCSFVRPGKCDFRCAFFVWPGEGVIRWFASGRANASFCSPSLSRSFPLGLGWGGKGTSPRLLA